MAPDPLRGRGILVTRPGERAANLARLIEGAGGRAHLFPAIEIEDLPAPTALAQLDRFDLAVFVSPTAVSKIMAHLAAWPRALPAAAVGGGPGASSSAAASRRSSRREPARTARRCLRLRRCSR